MEEASYFSELSLLLKNRWASLIAGMEYGTERWNGKWNGKWNGTVNIHSLPCVSQGHLSLSTKTIVYYSLAKPDLCFLFESLALQDYNNKSSDDEPATVPC